MYNDYELNNRQFNVDPEQMLNTIATIPDRSFCLIPRSTMWVDSSGALWLSPNDVVYDEKMTETYFQKPSDLVETITKHLSDYVVEMIKVDGKYIVLDSHIDELHVPEVREYFGIPVNHVLGEEDEQGEFFEFIAEHYGMNNAHEELQDLSKIFDEITDDVNRTLESYRQED